MRAPHTTCLLMLPNQYMTQAWLGLRGLNPLPRFRHIGPNENITIRREIVFVEYGANMPTNALTRPFNGLSYCRRWNHRISTAFLELAGFFFIK